MKWSELTPEQTTRIFEILTDEQRQKIQLDSIENSKKDFIEIGYTFRDCEHEFKTKRPFAVTLYFDSDHGCPGQESKWFDKLKYLSNEDDTLKGVSVIKFKMDKGECFASIGGNVWIRPDINK